MSHFLHFIFTLFAFMASLSLIKSLRYSVTTSSNEMIHFDESVITSEEGAKRITIQEEFHIFDKDLLDIKERTKAFIMNKNNILHRLECGSFDDQEITETILISNTQVKIIPRGAFRNLKIFELILTDNEITTIEEKAITDLPKLETVKLSRNKIVRFYENSFVDAPAKLIDLAFNQLEEVGENWFSFMSAEEPSTILLDNNDIETVDSGAFDGVMLDTLNLRNNNLEEIPGEIFEGDTVRTLYLQDNKLERLPREFYELTSLRLADLTGNPLRCEEKKKLKKLDEGKILFEEDC